MSLLRVMLFVSAVASVGYAAGRLVPNLYPSPEMAPGSLVWSRSLVPIYLGVAVMAWEGFRRPSAATWVAWASLVVWSGYVVVHLVDLALGDESFGLITGGLLLMDVGMSGLLLAAILRQGPALAASTP
jgi:hypothetical protein